MKKQNNFTTNSEREILLLQKELENLRKVKEHNKKKKELEKEKKLLKKEILNEIKKEKFLESKTGQFLNFFMVMIKSIFQGIFLFFKKLINLIKKMTHKKNQGINKNYKEKSRH